MGYRELINIDAKIICENLLEACTIFKNSDKNYFGEIEVDYDHINNHHIILLDRFIYFKNLSKKINIDNLIKFFHESICFIMNNIEPFCLNTKQIIYYDFNGTKYVHELNSKILKNIYNLYNKN